MTRPLSTYSNGFGFANLPATVPDTRVNSVPQAASGALSNYNGLTASLKQSMWKGFTGRLNFTWSHAIDDVSNGGLSQYSFANSIIGQFDPYCLRCLNYSSSDYDVRTYLSGSYVWDLPVTNPTGSEGYLGRLDNLADSLSPHGSAIHN